MAVQKPLSSHLPLVDGERFVVEEDANGTFAVPSLHYVLSPAGLFLPASAELDSAGKAITRMVDSAPWAYNVTFGDKQVAITRGVPVSVTTHSAVTILTGAMGVEISVPIKGYKQAIIFVKSDQTYDLNYRLSDPVLNGMQLALVSGQAVTGADARSHPLVVGGVWLFGDTLKIAPKNTSVSTAIMTVTVYLIP